MDHETISRKDKIELARKLAGSRRNAGYQSCPYLYDSNGQEMPASSFTSRFFLRLLLSAFLFLSVLAVTDFHAMGEKKAEYCREKLSHALISQQGVEQIKGEIDKLLR